MVGSWFARIDKDFYQWVHEEATEKRKSVREVTKAMANNRVFVQAIIENQNNVRRELERLLQGRK